MIASEELITLLRAALSGGRGTRTRTIGAVTSYQHAGVVVGHLGINCNMHQPPANLAPSATSKL